MSEQTAIVTYSTYRIIPVTKTFVLPKGYSVVTTGRLPLKDEYYTYVVASASSVCAPGAESEARLASDEGVPVVYRYDAAFSLNGPTSLPDRYIILKKATRRVIRFTLTDEHRVPNLDEWYLSEKDNPLRKSFVTVCDGTHPRAYPILRREDVEEPV